MCAINALGRGGSIKLEGLAVLSHLNDAYGILQADGYKGYAKLYAHEANGVPRLHEVACWVHLRRDFHDFWASNKSEIAREALDWIGKLYDIERDINGQPTDVRHAARQKLNRPKAEAFDLFQTDGRVAIDNNPAKYALRPIGIGRKN